MLLNILWAGANLADQYTFWSKNYAYSNTPQGVKEDTNTHEANYTRVNNAVKVHETKRESTRQEFEGIRTGYEKLEQKAAKGQVSQTGQIENAHTRQRVSVAKKTKLEQQPEHGVVHIQEKYDIPLYFPIPKDPAQNQSLAFIPQTPSRIEDPKIANCHAGKCEWTVGQMTGTEDNLGN